MLDVQDAVSTIAGSHRGETESYVNSKGPRATYGLDSSKDLRVCPAHRPRWEGAARKNETSAQREAAEEAERRAGLHQHYHGHGQEQRSGGKSPSPYDNGRFTPGGKRHVAKPPALSGQYDLLNNEWREMPSSPEVLDRESPLPGARPVSGRLPKAISGGYSPLVGKYDIILHHEEVPAALPQYIVRDMDAANSSPGKRPVRGPVPALDHDLLKQQQRQGGGMRGAGAASPGTPGRRGAGRPGPNASTLGAGYDPIAHRSPPPAERASTPGKRHLVAGGVPASQVAIAHVGGVAGYHHLGQRRHVPSARSEVQAGCPFGLDEPPPPPTGWQVQSPFATGGSFAQKEGEGGSRGDGGKGEAMTFNTLSLEEATPATAAGGGAMNLEGAFEAEVVA